MNLFRGAIRLSKVAILLSVSTIAIAQQSAPTPDKVSSNTDPSVTNSTEVDDIIVTAQRRDESLSRTPVAVSVLTSDALNKAQVKTEQDLRLATPGLQVRAGLTDTQLNFSLRGQSQDPFSDSRPGVIPYFNEVPIGGQGISTALYDLASVQVLKGPQGTLFGRNSTGGAVLYTTTKPTFDFGGYVSAGYGNFNALKLEGAVNAPIANEVAAIRVAGFYSEKNGFQRNLFEGGRRIGDRHREGARVSLLLTPGSGIKNSTVYDYYHTSGQNTAQILSGLLVGQANFPVTFFYPGMISELAAQQARGPRVVNYNDFNIFRANVNSVVNTTEIEIGSNATLKNIFGFQRSVAKLAIDGDASPFGIQNYRPAGPQTTTSRQYSNELQINGTAFDDRLNYVVGGFWSDEKLNYKVVLTFFDVFGGVTDSYDHDLTSKTLAGYAQGTYKLNDSGLSATAGLRYSSEKVGLVIYNPPRDIGRGIFCSVPGYDCDQSNTYNSLSWTFGLQNQVSSNLLLYVANRRSHKSGGYNGFFAPKVGDAAAGGNAYGAEEAIDIEAGLKFNGSLGTIPFRTNLAAYHAWTKNGQRAAYVTIGQQLGAVNVNVPRQKTYGVELETQLRPARWLDVGGTFNYTHAKFTDGRVLVLNNDPANPLGPPIAIPKIYDQVPDTPRTSGSVFADVTIPTTATIDLVLHGDLYFQSKTQTSARSFNNAGSTIGGYTLANFRVGVQDEDAGWSLMANLKNAFDKQYFVGGLSSGESVEYNALTPAEPRTYMVEARFKF